jgi:hypothetical protein
MESLSVITPNIKRALVIIFSSVLLVFISINVVAQTNSPNQHPEGQSQAEQASGYLNNMEKEPNAYTPGSSEWYAQPWIWAIVAAILILFIGMIARNSGRKEVDSSSENGLR